MISHAQELRVLFPPQEKHKFIELVTKPPRDAGRAFDVWTFRELKRTATEQNILPHIAISTIHAWLKEAALKPWQFKYWLNSTDPDFERKMFDVIRLYLEPPPNSTVLCIDEKTGIQALERAFADHPMRPGKITRREFNYIRHGTRALFAALNPHTGKVFGKCFERQRSKEFLSFLIELLDREKDSGKEIHIILDNLKTHSTEEVRKYVADFCGWDWGKMTEEERKTILMKPNKRVVFHFLPIHASWLNQIEIWFSILSRGVLKRGSFQSIQELEQRILEFIQDYNQHRAKPFKWTYTGQPLAPGIPM